MQDFSIQVLATLVSTLIIFGANQLIKVLKKVPINFWHNLLYCVGIFITYLFNVNNIVMHLRLLINMNNINDKYIIFLVSFALCIYVTIDLSIFIKKEFFNKKFNN